MPRPGKAPVGPLPGTPTAEHHRTALGIGESAPRLSWTMDRTPSGWRQTAYEVEVADGERRRTSGRITSPDSVLVPWPDEPLAARARRSVRVRVWGGESSDPSPWSPALELETGLLEAADWRTVMVGPPAGLGERERPVLLRGALTLPAPPRSARLYVTAHGVFEAEVNGVRVGDEVLAPGWTTYPARLRYRTHDVTGLLREGSNVLGAHLADGWYRGRIGFHGGRRDTYGDRTGLLAQLEVECEDGSTVLFGTGPDWRCAPSPTLASSLYDGERHDARLERTGWSEPGFDDADWAAAVPVERDPATLVAPLSPPVRCTEEVEPVSVTPAGSGRLLLDFGQNLVGRLRLRLRAPEGTEVTVRHAEVLEDGELCTRPLRFAEATDTYVAAGTGAVEEWEPRFTYHGFRYAEVTGWPGEPEPGAVVARVLHTDMRPTGEFSCSDPLVERLHENVRWSMRGNFVDVPTDCPQRDERLGWTGDIQVFAPTASFLYDCAGMLRSWLADLAAEQYPDGTVPFIVPTIHAPTWTPAWPAAVWGDAAVLTPWRVYEHFGDERVLSDQYASAGAWMELVAGRLDEDGTWRRDRQLGDWLDPAAPPEDPFRGRTDPTLVATAYAAESARTMSETARVLGKEADRERYARLAEHVRSGFRAAYAPQGGLLSSDTQAAYALALCFGLLPEGDERTAAADRLAALVARDGYRIATGFAGTPLVCDALTRHGHTETAYRLLLQQEAPSWLYPVRMGATTVWERWDSMLPDGRVNPGEMTSFNHYALGAVADWLHRTVAGLAPEAPGYRRIRFAPRPGGGMERAGAAHETPYGTASVRWHRDGARLHVAAVVPAGTTAVVDLPGADPFEVGSGEHRFEAPWPSA
ncbi:alpha-L-rhamnosidase [Nocardiopsis terrae]|uniref:alpha-L-rhamnosidase n=1 Tax=Nocardiopsis terrae TaxID=372655 RepID=A0ABR9HG22_9ACTN|nr:alpha-L-rhamnosidase [Nocardiopsis terrae]MBE1457987.1 alpha-L-rhamnosidase [Nocardiopsis terrae]GHC83178.1 alpha-L-rhamnosidase [Nocardiopsis terrae]